MIAGLRVAGCIDDAAPDQWGRRVILNRVVGREASTTDTHASRWRGPSGATSSWSKMRTITGKLGSDPRAAAQPTASHPRCGTIGSDEEAQPFELVGHGGLVRRPGRSSRPSNARVRVRIGVAPPINGAAPDQAGCGPSAAPRSAAERPCRTTVKRPCANARVSLVPEPPTALAVEHKVRRGQSRSRAHLGTR